MSAPLRLALLAALVLAVAPVGCGGKQDDVAPSKDTPKNGGGDSTDAAKKDALARLRVTGDLLFLGLAVQTFVDMEGAYPPADGASTQKMPAGLSWRAHIVHNLGTHVHTSLISDNLRYNKYPAAPDAKPGETWNRTALKSMSFDWILAEKPEHARTKTWDTPYRVFVGGGAAFEPGKRLGRKDFPRSSAYAILVVEAAESVPWPKPDELAYDPAKPLPKLGGLFPDGFYAVFADGSVRFIKNGTDEKLIRAMITRGGEKVELPPRVDRAALAKTAGVPFGTE
jgi:hypothetical protein